MEHKLCQKIDTIVSKGKCQRHEMSLWLCSLTYSKKAHQIRFFAILLYFVMEMWNYGKYMWFILKNKRNLLVL